METYEIRGPQSANDTGISAAKALEQVWDPDEVDRFAKLAQKFPELLNYDEEMLWKLISENEAVWQAWYDEDGEYLGRDLKMGLLREHWATFRKVANGDLTKDKLPGSKKKAVRNGDTTTDSYKEDDIPF